MSSQVFCHGLTREEWLVSSNQAGTRPADRPLSGVTTNHLATVTRKQ
jgi:hypothetical protein